MKNELLNIITITDSSPLKQNTYLVMFKDTSILIDCGAPFQSILSAYNNKFPSTSFPKIDAVFLTHTHFDHILYLKEIDDLFHPIIYAKVGAKSFIQNPRHNMSILIGENLTYLPTNLIEISTENDISVKDIILTPIFTPGHTECSVCYKIAYSMFTGDTIFNSGVGRTDLPTGNYSALLQSIKHLQNFPADLYYPGHSTPFKML